MKLSMRLFKRRHRSGKFFWYIEIKRGRRYSTGCEVGKDDAEAHRLFNKARKEYLAGKLSFLTDSPSRMLLADFAQEYLDHGRRTNKARATLTKDEQALRYFLNFAGSQIRLSEINRRLVESWLASLDMKPVSRNTYFRHFKAALSKAVDWDYLKRNPCQGVKQLRDQEPPPRSLTVQEIEALLAAEEDSRYRTLWRFYLATGCRRAEALQIRREDIDLERQVILLRRTKTKRGRYLPIIPEVAEILEEIPVQVGRLWPWQPDTVTHHFRITAQTAGIQARLHDLRHTYGTHQAGQGMAPWILKTLMGHSDLKTTQRYVHLSPADLATGKNGV